MMDKLAWQQRYEMQA
ncbi:unnamed protein product, partial [Didymodactylos carnosus]